MKKMKLKLGPDTPFWFLGPVKLTIEDNLSSWIYINKLPSNWVKVINKAAQLEHVVILDENSKYVQSVAEALESEFAVETFKVGVEDIKTEEALVPEVVSVTVSDEEEEDEVVISDVERQEAVRILKKNANTIKSMLKRMDPIQNYTLLMAMLETESANKNRPGLIKAVKAALDK